MRVDIERALIGHVFAFGQADEFSSRFESNDFATYPDFASTIRELSGHGVPVNYITVSDRLGGEDSGKCRTIVLELMDCTSCASLPSDFDKLCLILYEHVLRSEVRKTREIRDEDDVFDYLDSADEKIKELVSRMKVSGYLPSEVLVKITNMEAGVLTYGMPLDVSVALTDLVVLAARPSMGKTAFAIRCALNTARMGLPVGFASKEMSQEEVGARVLSMLSRIPFQRIISKQIFAGEEEALDNAAEEFANLPLYIFEPPSNLNTAIVRCKELIARKGVKALFVDYLQLFNGTGDNREQRIADVSRSFKALAMESRVPVMLLSQLSRDVEKRSSKMPHLADLRESGAIEQDANIVMMLYRPWYYEDERKIPVTIGDDEYPPSEDLVVIGVEKYRNGKTGRRAMKWVGEYMDFRPRDEQIF